LKHVFVALAALGLLVSGCGPAESSEDVGTENGSVEQKITPCLAGCYPSCTGTTAQINACKANCRVECAGS